MNLFKQVKGFIPRNYIVCQFKHYLHYDNGLKNTVLYPLSRGLVRVTGEDTSEFLQGLITNDMRHFDTGAQSIYAMFLNNKGRVLYDTLIHKWDTSESYMIECDSKLLTSLLKHLKMFKLRRNLQIEDASKDFNLWVITQVNPDTKTNDALKIYKDPRLTDLGLRIIASNTLKDCQIAEHFGNDISLADNDDGYKYLRYKLGVSEGADDLPPAANFPLEANCDYLHGVSFHKGCYIGQEVTARVHHTGVVRKRIMPLKFIDPPSQISQEQIDPNIVTANSPNRNLGKIKGIIKNYGIGLIRIKEALEAKTVKVNNYPAEPYKPTWWPLEAPKEISKVKETV